MRARSKQKLQKFADRMRARRHELDISQHKLACLVDCHVNAIGSIERGQADPSLTLVYRIAEALQIPPRELVE